jgi:hypothetical protein
MLESWRGKRLIWTTYFRLFTCGGFPKMRYIPKFRRSHYAAYWGMRGFVVYWLSHEFNFSFGKDIHNHYA